MQPRQRFQQSPSPRTPSQTTNNKTVPGVSSNTTTTEGEVKVTSALEACSPGRGSNSPLALGPPTQDTTTTTRASTPPSRASTRPPLASPPPHGTGSTLPEEEVVQSESSLPPLMNLSRETMETLSATVQATQALAQSTPTSTSIPACWRIHGRTSPP